MIIFNYFLYHFILKRCFVNKSLVDDTKKVCRGQIELISETLRNFPLFSTRGRSINKNIYVNANENGQWRKEIREEKRERYHA